jgi:hypothetical protein
MRRYFSSHKDVLLRLAEEGWTRWSASVCGALRARRSPAPAALAEVLVSGLSADPLFCDLLANVPLHLEHDVDVERVKEFKRKSQVAVTAMADAIEERMPGLGSRGALDVVIAANALAANLWQVSHPSDALALTYADEPAVVRTAAFEFAPTLTRLLTATCEGQLGDVSRARS